ncbi:hypothetical protein M8009_12855 [Halomonas sp. ATCH28]|uniref:Uncharacterized protein n=1 Tax=Halomonas gemina TaxID=2945105 RepID=A0ABT0T2M3_9GAMM|nr:hypothetical protein [Halomonas gemina]MCL7941175.1 hypothetical protein [Halomonas gemina]
MNRTQRRAAAKAQRHNRAAGMGRAGVDRYIARARRWLIGARFDGIPIQQEQGGEVIHGLHGTWRFPPSVPADRRMPAAEYGEAGKFLWRIEAETVFVADNGDEYRHTVELETGQAQQLAELTDTWRDMLQQARDGGNPRHHHHDVVRAWPLVTKGEGR